MGNWTRGQWKKVAWPDKSHFLLHHVVGLVHVCRLPGKKMTPGCTTGRRQADGGSVKLWAMFYWETLGRAILVDVTLTQTTYLNTVADQVHPFMETVFPYDGGVFQQDNAPWCQIPSTFRGLVESMPRQVRTILAERGGPTQFYALVETQVFVCLWKGCKVYNTPSTSQSWLQRHMLTHSGDKPFKCVVGGCNATFASQGGLARHVPTHFSSQSSAKVSSQGKVKEESPSKAGLNKRRKLKNKHRRSLPRPHDFFDAQTMDAIRHRAICLNLATHIESLGNGHSVVFHSTVIARRKEDTGKVKVLLHWTPEDIMPDVWVNECDRLQQKTKVVHLSKLPTDTAVLLDPNIYRMFF